MLKEKEVTEDTLIKTIAGANPEEAVDVEVAKIMKEKWSAFNGFDDTHVVRDGAFDDVEEGEGVEVWFWCVLVGMWNIACTNILLTLLILLAVRRLRDQSRLHRFHHHILMLRCLSLIW
jgi:hypothetical protein